MRFGGGTPFPLLPLDSFALKFSNALHSSKPVPNDAQHLHFGAGQTETTLELAPGKHTLQLLLGDYVHLPQQPPIFSEVITITVE